MHLSAPIGNNEGYTGCLKLNDLAVFNFPSNFVGLLLDLIMKFICLSSKLMIYIDCKCVNLKVSFKIKSFVQLNYRFL